MMNPHFHINLSKLQFPFLMNHFLDKLFPRLQNKIFNLIKMGFILKKKNTKKKNLTSLFSNFLSFLA